MTSISELLELEIPGYGWISWETQLDELLPWFPGQNVLRREEHPGHPEFATDQCPGRSAILTTTGRVCGADAMVKLNFCDGRLCAAHYDFVQTTDLGDREYCAILECLRRRLTSAFGPSGMRTKVAGHGDVSFRWSPGGLHVEMRAFRDQRRQIQLAANDPAVCSWCFTP